VLAEASIRARSFAHASALPFSGAATGTAGVVGSAIAADITLRERSRNEWYQHLAARK
jgi:hypothetical protein